MIYLENSLDLVINRWQLKEKKRWQSVKEVVFLSFTEIDIQFARKILSRNDTKASTNLSFLCSRRLKTSCISIRCIIIHSYQVFVFFLCLSLSVGCFVFLCLSFFVCLCPKRTRPLSMMLTIIMYKTSLNYLLFVDWVLSIEEQLKTHWRRLTEEDSKESRDEPRGQFRDQIRGQSRETLMFIEGKKRWRLSNERVVVTVCLNDRPHKTTKTRNHTKNRKKNKM